MSCHGRGKLRQVLVEEFQVDPLLESAELRLRSEGYDHSVSWDGKGEGPQQGTDAGAGEDGLGADAYAELDERGIDIDMKRNGTFEVVQHFHNPR